MYADQRQARVRRDFPEGLDEPAALAALARDLQDAEHSELLELRHQDRTRIFNLGYFTWVEQQGVSLEAFEVRRRQAFWDGLMEQVGAWDELIAEFNAQVGAPATA
jgi:hypothetical protein